MSAARLAVAIAGASVAAGASNLVLLSDPAARCLDGSAPGYYFKQGTVNSFVLWFEGGGWCNSLEDCYQRSMTRLGSSTTWAPTATFGGILNENVTINPDFSDWSTVYVKYCDGSSFTSDATLPVPYNATLSLYYRGRATLEALLHELVTDHGLAAADALVVTGSSAGGVSTYIHVDWFASSLPGVTVVGVPDAGFFPLAPAFNGAYTFTQDTLVWMVSAFNISSAAQVNAACFAATPPGALSSCLSAPMFYPRVQSPLFVVNSMEDWAQLTGWAGLPQSCVDAPLTNCTADEYDYFQGWSAQFTGQLNISIALSPRGLPRAAPLSPPSWGSGSAAIPPPAFNGGFIASCVQHEQVYVDRRFAGDVIGGRLMRDAIADWLFSRNGSLANHWRFDVSWPGNPSCQPPGP